MTATRCPTCRGSVFGDGERLLCISCGWERWIAEPPEREFEGYVHLAAAILDEVHPPHKTTRRPEAERYHARPLAERGSNRHALRAHLAAMPTHTVVCQCGVAFETAMTKRMWCSRICRERFRRRGMVRV